MEPAWLGLGVDRALPLSFLPSSQQVPAEAGTQASGPRSSPWDWLPEPSQAHRPLKALVSPQVAWRVPRGFLGVLGQVNVGFLRWGVARLPCWPAHLHTPAPPLQPRDHEQQQLQLLQAPSGQGVLPTWAGLLVLGLVLNGLALGAVLAPAAGGRRPASMANLAVADLCLLCALPFFLHFGETSEDTLLCQLSQAVPAQQVHEHQPDHGHRRGPLHGRAGPLRTRRPRSPAGPRPCARALGRVLAPWCSAGSSDVQDGGLSRCPPGGTPPPGSSHCWASTCRWPCWCSALLQVVTA